jgi:ribosomal protein S18 acetylase RimI-like enzyme
MNIQIELMRETDLAEVVKIFVDTFNASGEHWSHEFAAENIKEGFFGKCHYIALVDKKIVGFILAIPLTRELGTELFVASIAVIPEYQNQGVGQLLWDKMESYAQENKFAAIRLLTNPNFKSYKWYKQMGFKESNWIEVFKPLK